MAAYAGAGLGALVYACATPLSALYCGSSTSAAAALVPLAAPGEHTMHDAARASATEHVLLRLAGVLGRPGRLPGYNKHDPASYGPAAMSAWLFSSRGGGVCDVLAPAELQRRLLSRHLGLGLPPDVVRRCVVTLACIGGHVRYCDVVQALRGAHAPPGWRPTGAAGHLHPGRRRRLPAAGSATGARRGPPGPAQHLILASMGRGGELRVQGGVGLPVLALNLRHTPSLPGSPGGRNSPGTGIGSRLRDPPRARAADGARCRWSRRPVRSGVQRSGPL